MTALALGFISDSDTSPRVDNGGLLHNQTITVQTVDVAARVGQGNFVNLIGVQPYLALSAFQDGGRQALLQFE